jgi:hypothetical protein
MFRALDGLGLRQAHVLDLQVQILEDVAHRIVGATANLIDIHLLAMQLLDRRDVGARRQMHFRIVWFGSIHDLVVEQARLLVRMTEIVQDAHLRQAEVDTLQAADVANSLRSRLLLFRRRHIGLSVIKAWYPRSTLVKVSDWL